MLLSELDFGSYLTYTPRGNSELEKRSKQIMYILKNEDTLRDPPKFMSQLVAETIKRDLSKLPFKDFFNPDISLVPVPKSSLMQPNALWIPKKLAESFSKQGFGECYPCLKRVEAVPKAAFARPEDRPKAIDHYNSIECQPLVRPPKKIVLIDDIITRGATMLGCASKLRGVFPDVPIKGFAIIRTISDPNDFKKIEDSCVGTIKLINDETHREP